MEEVKSTILVQTEISQQLMDVLAWNDMQSFWLYLPVIGDAQDSIKNGQNLSEATFWSCKYATLVAIMLDILLPPPPGESKNQQGCGSSADLRRAEWCLGAWTSHQ